MFRKILVGGSLSVFVCCLALSGCVKEQETLTQQEYNNLKKVVLSSLQQIIPGDRHVGFALPDYKGHKEFMKFLNSQNSQVSNIMFDLMRETDSYSVCSSLMNYLFAKKFKYYDKTKNINFIKSSFNKKNNILKRVTVEAIGRYKLKGFADQLIDTIESGEVGNCIDINVPNCFNEFRILKRECIYTLGIIANDTALNYLIVLANKKERVAFDMLARHGSINVVRDVLVPILDVEISAHNKKIELANKNGEELPDYSSVIYNLVNNLAGINDKSINKYLVALYNDTNDKNLKFCIKNALAGGIK